MQNANMIDWNDIPYFIAVAESGSLASAASKLSVNHSTVYRRINALEEKLGVNLFDRNHDGYSLTSPGEYVLEHAHNAENSIHRFGRAVAGSGYKLSGRILVTAPSSSLISTILAPCVAQFHAKQPDVQIDLNVTDGTLDLAKREADVALRAIRNPPEQLIGRKVCDIEWYLFASKRYLKKYGHPDSMDDLFQHKLIGANGLFGYVDSYKWFNQKYPDKNFAFKASDLKTISSLAMQSLGIVMLPSDYIDHTLEKLFKVDPGFNEELWMLIHPDLQRVERIRVFCDFVYDYLKNSDFVNCNNN